MEYPMAFWEKINRVANVLVMSVINVYLCFY